MRSFTRGMMNVNADHEEGNVTERDLQRVDLNLLVAFDVLMSERSVTRAAARMQLGQPAMSAALARLRRLFDDRLLVREGRTLVPTPVAESLIGPVRQALALMESALGQRSGFDPAKDERTFTILTSDYFLVLLLRPLLAALRREAPGVRIHARQVDADYADVLRQGLFDLCIVPRESQRSEVTLRSEDLFTDRVMCAVDSANPEVGDRLTLEQFQTLPYVAFSGGPALETTAQRQLRALGIDRPIDVSAHGFVSALIMLRDTPMFTLVHEHLGISLTEQARLRLLEPPVALDPITATMYWLPRQDESPAHQWLRRQFRESAAAL
ncbi:LysR family transcriptional regulator [Tsukamurella pseudospumae]|nr:LysR family transcriptional regulator [Tsukamurella pseudospumae]